MGTPEREEIETLFQAPLERYKALGMVFPEGVVVNHEVPERKYWYSSR